MSKANKDIRKIETDFLDKEYLRYPVISLRRSQDRVIWCLLNIYNSYLNKGQGIGYDNVLLRSHALVERKSIDFCLTWISGKQTLLYLPPVSDTQVLHETIELFEWGKQYASLVNDHMGWGGGRGLVKAQIDHNQRSITFIYPDFEDMRFWQTQIAIEEAYRDPRLDLKITGDISLLRDKLSKGESLYNTLEYQQILGLMIRRTILPDLPNKFELGGYTLHDYRSVFATLFLVGIIGLEVEVFAERTLVGWMSKMSNVSEAACRAIIEDITFDVTNAKSVYESSIMLQPLIKSETNQIYVLFSYICTLNPEQILIRLLNKDTSRKSIYDRNSTLIEKQDSDRIKEFLPQHFDVRQEEIFKCNGKDKKPDFVLVHPNRKELLIVEYKRMLPPFTTGETKNKAKELRCYQKQLQDYINCFKNHINLKEYFPELSDDHKIYGILLFRWPMPLPVQPKTSIIDLLSFQKFFKDYGNAPFGFLLNWISKRPDLLIPTIEDKNYLLPKIQVGGDNGWIYQYRFE